MPHTNRLQTKHSAVDPYAVSQLLRPAMVHFWDPLVLRMFHPLLGLESRLAECRFDAEIPATDGYGDTFNAFLPLLSTAFSCDLTRVISLQMGQIPSQELFPGETFDIHADAAHKVWVNAHSADVMTQYTRYHAAQLATLATMLDSVIDPQGDGVASLLDNTMIVWAGELGDGAHGFERWPAVIVGGNRFSSFKP